MENFKRTVRDVAIAGRAVFLRVAYDLPLDTSKGILDPKRISDDSRIRDTIPTIKYILGQKPSKLLIAAGWQGRPDGEDAEMTMAPAALILKELLNAEGYKINVTLAPNCLDGSKPRSVYRNKDEVRSELEKLDSSTILVFENVRYDKEANKCDAGFGEFMASLAGKNALYVNEAEPQNHRPEATVKLVPSLIVKNVGDAVFGLKYFDVMDKIGSIGTKLRENQRGNFVFFLAGKKIEVQPGITSKISVAHALLDSMKAGDCIVVAGAVTYTFLLAQEYYDVIDINQVEIGELLKEANERISNETKGMDSESATKKENEIRNELNQKIMSFIGMDQNDISSLIGSSFRRKGQEAEQAFYAYQVLAKSKEKDVQVITALDHIIANVKMSAGILPKESEIKVFDNPTGIPDGWFGVAPGPKTIGLIEALYQNRDGISLQAGPLQIEDSRVEQVSQANKRLGNIMRKAKASGWITIAAGGDTAAEVARWHNEDAFSVISNAGGATLELLESGTSIGIEAIKEAVKLKA